MKEPSEEVKRVEQRYEKALDDMEQHYKDVLEQIRDEIESMDFDFGDYYDNTNEIIEMVCKVIDKYTKEQTE